MPPQEPNLPARIKWNEITWYSKLGAIILFFGIVPTLAFYIGTRYEQVQQMTGSQTSSSNTTRIPINQMPEEDGSSPDFLAPEVCPFSSDRNKLSSTTIYKNQAIGLQLSVPAGWYIPTAEDSDPHFYICAMDPNIRQGIVDGFEIQNHTDLLEENGTFDLQDYKEVPTVATGARVYQDLGEVGAGGWGYGYYISFPAEKRLFFIFTHEDVSTYSFFNTLKPI